MRTIFEQRAIIREVLLREWDPIGVGDMPEAQDEYDSDIGAVLTLVEKRSTAAEIFQYLWKVETDHMGAGGNRERTERAATTLAALSGQL